MSRRLLGNGKKICVLMSRRLRENGKKIGVLRTGDFGKTERRLVC